MVAWNNASATGKFAPHKPAAPIAAQPPKHRTLLSEEPIEAIWLRLRQLTSVTLARKLVRRKLEAERFAQHLAQRLDAHDKTLAAARAAQLDRREQLDVMRQKAELLTDRAAAETTGLGDDPSAARSAVGDDEVEVAFLRERERRKPS